MNSGCARSSSTTRGCHCAWPSTSRTVRGWMPACKACVENASRHAAKPAVWSTPAVGLPVDDVASWADVLVVAEEVLAGSGVFTASGRWRGAAAQPARARAAQHAARESRDEEDKWAGRSRETEGLAGWVLCMRHCPALQRRCCAAGVSRREAASDEVFGFAIYFIAASALSVCARGLKSL